MTGGGGIFVSYRRQESGPLAGRLKDKLASRFGEHQVFMDVDTIEPGVDFAEEIFRAVTACKVLLAVIGPAWLTASDKQGGRKLDDPDDIVRLEIGTALTRGVRVIPILTEGAAMPSRQDLPESLASLARRHAVPVRNDSFHSDTGPLITAIERALAAPVSRAAAGDAVHFGGDAARAFRLYADVERIAGSITNAASKALVLSDIAQALAATDPVFASRLVNDIEQITSPVSMIEVRKALALTGIARVVAVTDPHRAARHLTEVERAVRSIAGEKVPELALRDLVGAVSATDPDRAERMAAAIADATSKAVALSGIVQAVVAIDPDRASRILIEAEHIANSISTTYNPPALSGVAQAVAATDPDRAEQIASSVNPHGWKALAVSGIARAVAAADPDRATRLLADAERIVRSARDDVDEAALSDIAGITAATDPDRAEDIASRMGGGHWQASALSGIARAVAASDPDRAVRIANSIIDLYWKASALTGIGRLLAE
jgi:hypothetical protein